MRAASVIPALFVPIASATIASGTCAAKLVYCAAYPRLFQRLAIAEPVIDSASYLHLKNIYVCSLSEDSSEPGVIWLRQLFVESISCRGLKFNSCNGLER